jgi:hypothetical protein
VRIRRQHRAGRPCWGTADMDSERAGQVLPCGRSERCVATRRPTVAVTICEPLCGERSDERRASVSRCLAPSRHHRPTQLDGRRLARRRAARRAPSTTRAGNGNGTGVPYRRRTRYGRQNSGGRAESSKRTSTCLQLLPRRIKPETDSGLTGVPWCDYQTVTRTARMLVIVLLLGTTACTGSPRHRAASSRPPSSTDAAAGPTGVSYADLCGGGGGCPTGGVPASLRRPMHHRGSRPGSARSPNPSAKCRPTSAPCKVLVRSTRLASTRVACSPSSRHPPPTASSHPAGAEPRCCGSAPRATPAQF